MSKYYIKKYRIILFRFKLMSKNKYIDKILINIIILKIFKSFKQIKTV